MTTCPSCGVENPPRARFCMECGAPLGAAARPEPEPSPVPRSEERRVVSILFVDLVGFTERSDQADPEDVRRTLVPFHSLVKADLERFGGTLDKFIGDAALGVFGAPIAHEDDPERAVRSGLAILRSIEDLRRTDPDIAVRVAVNTGEAVVAFGTGPQVGEAVAGDVVNTTSRMQNLAPRDSMVIGEGTLRAVRDLFDVEELPPAMVKGKTEPLRLWRVLGEQTEARPSRLPVGFVGREDVLASMERLVEEVGRSSTARMVTVTGDPGIGKSRLMAELRGRLSGRVRWLAGRCLPYGEAVTFAPAATTVRQVAGIDPIEGAAEQAIKLAALAARVEADASQREWLLSRLSPMLGLETAGLGATIPSEETARAWTLVVALAAEQSRPDTLVLHLDDLHWADPVFLELVLRLSEGLEGQPVLLLCASRPELLDRTEGWTTGRPGAEVIRLPALTAVESSRLVDEALASAPLPERARAELVERTGGNPLYALEFSRMLVEREEGLVPNGPLALPESVHAVIGARLDAIPSSLRALVLDASVVGSTFWPGVLAAMGDSSEATVLEGLEALEQRGLVERAASSSIDDLPEFGFTHALVGEVAYGRIPRARRARGHLAAGRWIELVGTGQMDERTEMAARHFAAAVDLAEAAGEGDLADSARGPALLWLMAAGERAGRLDARAAFVLYDRAISLAQSESREGAEALALSAQMGRRSGRLNGPEVLRRHEESLAVYRRLGDPIGIGKGLTRVGSQLGALGEFGRSGAVLGDAVKVLEAEAPGPELARAYAYRAEAELFAGHVRPSMEYAGRTLDLLPEGSNDEIRVMALHIRGDARCSLGDLAGLDDLREALRLAEAGGNPSDIVTSQSYVAEWLWATEGPAAGMVQIEESISIAESRGVVSQGQWSKAGSLDILFDLGDWDRAVLWAEELLELGQERVDGVLFAVANATRSRIARYRGDPAGARGAEYIAELARAVEELQALAPALLAAAELSVVDGRFSDALGYVEEFDLATRDVAASYRESRLAPLARVCAVAGDVEPVERMIAQSKGLLPRDRLHLASARAFVAHANSDTAAASLFRDAAEGWREFGVPLEEALALLGLAACEYGVREDRARELLRRLGVPFGHRLIPRRSAR